MIVMTYRVLYCKHGHKSVILMCKQTMYVHSALTWYLCTNTFEYIHIDSTHIQDYVLIGHVYFAVFSHSEWIHVLDIFGQVKSVRLVFLASPCGPVRDRNWTRPKCEQHFAVAHTHGLLYTVNFCNVPMCALVCINL